MYDRAGIDAEFRRLRDGLRAMGERVNAVAISDKQVQELLSTQSVIQHDIARILQNMEKQNGILQRQEEKSHAQDRRLSLVEQFCDQQVKPMLAIAQNNRIEIVKIAAKWAALAGVGGGGLGALGFYLAQLLSG